jgi:hypothetical protein
MSDANEFAIPRGAEDHELPEWARVSVRSTVPYLRELAVKRGNVAALILLQAQEALLRNGEHHVASMIAALVPPVLERDNADLLDRCDRAIAGALTEDMARLETEAREAMEAVGLGGEEAEAALELLLAARRDSERK